MFLGNFSVANSEANANIAINTLIATNRKVVNDTATNTLKLTKAGIYNIDGWVTLSGDTGTFAVLIFADGSLRDSIAVTTTADDQFVTVPIVDAVRAVLASYPEVADISLRVDTGGLTLDGVIRVEYLQ